MIERTPVSSEVEPQADLRQGDFLTLIATVNLTRKTGRIAYVHRLSQALVADVMPESDIQLRALNGR
jgi:hypothetical protein